MFFKKLMTLKWSIGKLYDTEAIKKKSYGNRTKIMALGVSFSEKYITPGYRNLDKTHERPNPENNILINQHQQRDASTIGNLAVPQYK